jgi:hypothetical protein
MSKTTQVSCPLVEVLMFAASQKLQLINVTQIFTLNTPSSSQSLTKKLQKELLPAGYLPLDKVK